MKVELISLPANGNPSIQQNKYQQEIDWMKQCALDYVDQKERNIHLSKLNYQDYHDSRADWFIWTHGSKVKENIEKEISKQLLEVDQFFIKNKNADFKLDLSHFDQHRFNSEAINYLGRYVRFINDDGSL